MIQLNLLLTAEFWVIHDDGIGLLAADWDRTSDGADCIQNFHITTSLTSILPSHPSTSIAKMASSPTLSNRIPPILILSILTIFGLDALLLQLNRNGYMDMLSSITNDPLPRFLPDTDRLLLKQYTGFKPLDDFFAMSNVIWANVTDGSSPQLSLFTFCFGGQLIATFMVFIIEGSRTVGLAPVVLK